MLSSAPTKIHLPGCEPPFDDAYQAESDCAQHDQTRLGEQPTAPYTGQGSVQELTDTRPVYSKEKLSTNMRFGHLLEGNFTDHGFYTMLMDMASCLTQSAESAEHRIQDHFEVQLRSDGNNGSLL